jgi:hypothetical protein
VLEVTLQCTYQVVLHMPLETELVATASQFLVALSASRNPARLHYLVASEHTHCIAQYTTSLSTGGAVGAASAGAVGGAGGAPQGACRLNGTGLSAMFEALGQLFVRARNEAFFSQVREVRCYVQGMLDCGWCVLHFSHSWANTCTTLLTVSIHIKTSCAARCLRSWRDTRNCQTGPSSSACCARSPGSPSKATLSRVT